MRNKPVTQLTVHELQGEHHDLGKRIITLRQANYFGRTHKAWSGASRRLELALCNRYREVKIALKDKYDAARKDIG